jgi:hypothetical protein
MVVALLENTLVSIGPCMHSYLDKLIPHDDWDGIRRDLWVKLLHFPL